MLSGKCIYLGPGKSILSLAIIVSFPVSVFKTNREICPLFVFVGLVIKGFPSTLPPFTPKILLISRGLTNP